MAQNVSIAGADYPAVPYLLIPITDGGGTNAKFVDTSGATASAAGDVVLGKTAFGSAGTLLTGSAAPTLTGTYTANTKNLAISTAGVTSTWFGAFNFEMIYESRWSKKVSEASNWPLTPSTSAQALTWVTDYTANANANATYDRYGKGYHGITAKLDFGAYNYVWLEDGFVKYAYTSDEATLGKVHVCASGFEMAYHWGARPRSANGAIIRPSSSGYGTYGSCNVGSTMSLYRTAANVINLANNTTYGVSAGAIAPSMSSTSSVTPDYFNLRVPSWGIRAHDTYMPVASYADLDATKTTLNFRLRIYRIPAEYGVYTVQNNRLLDMIQANAFPAEPL